MIDYVPGRHPFCISLHHDCLPFFSGASYIVSNLVLETVQYFFDASLFTYRFHELLHRHRIAFRSRTQEYGLLLRWLYGSTDKTLVSGDISGIGAGDQYARVA